MSDKNCLSKRTKVMERVKVKVAMETLILLSLCAFFFFFFNYELNLLVVSKSMGILSSIS